MAYKISNSCVACGTCIDECPVEAISAGDIYVIDADKCIDCGTCRRMPERGHRPRGISGRHRQKRGMPHGVFPVFFMGTGALWGRTLY